MAQVIPAPCAQLSHSEVVPSSVELDNVVLKRQSHQVTSGDRTDSCLTERFRSLVKIYDS